MERTVKPTAILAAALGAISAWAGRFNMDDDGISYLDMAEAYARGDWENALSGVWSPLYSWVLAPVLSVARPSTYWEFPLVHAVNLLIYFGALASLTYCIRQLILYRQDLTRDEVPSPSVHHAPEAALYVTGYAVFTFASLILIDVTNVGPHMTLAALTFLTTGLLLRVRMHPDEWQSWALFGFTLGLTYLARAQTLVFAVIFFALAVLPWGKWTPARRRLSRLIIALAIFCAVSSVYAVPLLIVKNRFGATDLVRLNYALYINRIPQRHWQGDPAYGKPFHPTRVMFSDPMVYEFDGPVGGSYPPWYDPLYWYEGVKPRFDLMGHVGLWRRNALRGLRLGGLPYPIPSFWVLNLMAYVLVVGFLLYRRMLSWSSVKAHAGLLIPVLVALAIYPALTIWPRRFVGGFLPLLWLGTIASVSWRGSRTGGLRAVTTLGVGLLIFHLALSVARVGGRALGSIGPSSSHTEWHVAQSLHAAGVNQGSKVALMGGAVEGIAHWARLARVKVVAEVPRSSTPEFWALSDERKRDLVAKLQAIGVDAIVVGPRARRDAPPPGGFWPLQWKELDGTGYLALMLRR